MDYKKAEKEILAGAWRELNGAGNDYGIKKAELKDFLNSMQLENAHDIVIFYSGWLGCLYQSENMRDESSNALSAEGRSSN